MVEEHSPEEKIQVAVIAQGDSAHLEELADVLEEAGVPHDIVSPPGASGLYLVTPPEAAQAANEAIAAHHDKDLPEDQRAASFGIVDLDAAETTCPACGTTFATETAGACPDCGLNLGG